jgi:hypothetical protein
VYQTSNLAPYDAVQFAREYAVEEFSYVGVNVAVTVGTLSSSFSVSFILSFIHSSSFCN